jgi:heme o synthase
MPPRSFSVQSIVSLARPTLSLFVAFIALSTHLYFRHAPDPETFFLFTGVFLLSCAASALNQIQERETDLLMERTRTRPLPAGRCTVQRTALLSTFLGALGLFLLYWGANPVSALWGAVAVFVYNAIYTPLKKRTPFALFPGAIAGAIPVLIGCAAAIGRIDTKAVYIALFVFLWQVPHFLLLLLRFDDDYRRSGDATLLSRISRERLKVIIRIWMLAAIAVTTLFPIAGIIRTIPLVTAIAGLNIYMMIILLNSFRGNTSLPSTGSLYVYQGIVFVLLIAQGIVGYVFP